MTARRRRALLVGGSALASVLVVACSMGSTPSADPAPTISATTGSSSASPSSSPTAPVAVYAHAGAGMLAPQAAKARSLVYVPNSVSDTVDVIDPHTYRVIDHFAVGHLPQHVVPSWDLKTLWVNDDLSNDLVPIDPVTGKHGKKVPVLDPYNLYFTPDGRHALVMAERYSRIDVRDPHTMALQRTISVPCTGVNHADFAADSSFFVASCEFSGKLVVVKAPFRSVSDVIDLNHRLTPGEPTGSMLRAMGGPDLVRGASAMPQDVRLAPDGRHFVVADMLRGGVWVIDAVHPKVVRFVRTGRGAHGIYPSRDAKSLYVSNRGAGSISVLDAATLKVRTVWHLPGGGSPDMGGVTVDGSQLWLSGRYDGVVYVLSTRTGRLLHTIRVGSGPHGLAVWPQPGRYSLGHTGNMR